MQYCNTVTAQYSNAICTSPPPLLSCPNSDLHNCTWGTLLINCADHLRNSKTILCPLTVAIYWSELAPNQHKFDLHWVMKQKSLGQVTVSRPYFKKITSTTWCAIVGALHRLLANSENRQTLILHSSTPHLAQTRAYPIKCAKYFNCFTPSSPPLLLARLAFPPPRSNWHVPLTCSFHPTSFLPCFVSITLLLTLLNVKHFK